MRQLSPEQRDLVSSLAERLGSIPGIRAVVLGGSYARGRAWPGSDIDLGIFYSETAPFSIQEVRALAEVVNDTPLNRKYLINDKTALEEVAELERAPAEFGTRVQETLARLGHSAAELTAAVEGIGRLLAETLEVTDGLYQPRYAMLK